MRSLSAITRAPGFELRQAVTPTGSAGAFLAALRRRGFPPVRHQERKSSQSKTETRNE